MIIKKIFTNFYFIDSVFYRYVKAVVKDGDVVMIASYDEMANSLVFLFKLI